MKKIIGLVTLAVLSCISASSANAAAFGSSLLQINGARLQILSSGIWVNASAAQITVLGGGITGSDTSAFLDPAYSDDNSNPIGLNAAQSFVSPTLSAPAEDTFASLGNPLADSYARSDTSGTGTSLISGGVSTKSISEVSTVDNAGGFSNGQTIGRGTFRINVSQSGTYRLAFGASLNLATTAGGFANSSWDVTLNNFSIFTVGNGAAGINKALSGNSSYSFTAPSTGAGLLFSDTRSLTAGSVHLFSITQLTGASVATVPEPTSLAVFGLLVVGAVIATRRNRKS